MPPQRNGNRIPEDASVDSASQTETLMSKKTNQKMPLTLKQARLVKALPSSDSVAEAGEKAGYHNRQSAHRALGTIREKMPDVLERHGLTPDYAADKCRHLMEAKETKFFANAGIVMETREVDANEIQLRALDAWAKMFGAYEKDNKIELDVRYHGFNLEGIPDEALFGILDLVKERSAICSENQS